MDKLRMSSFIKGELTAFVDFDTTRIELTNGMILIGNFDMKDLDNSWSLSETKEQENGQNKWWFWERESIKPILVDGEEIKDISLYHLAVHLCTFFEEGISASAIGPQIYN